MLWQLFMVVVLIYCAVLRWRARHRIAFAKNFKNNIKSLPILGHAYLFAQCKSDSDRWKILKKFGEEALKQGGTMCSWNLHRLYFVVADPVIAECVMKSCLEKDDAMKITVGSGSAVADVPIWRPRRKVLVPTFSQKYLLQFAKIFSKQSMTMVKQLQKLPDGLISISKHLTSYTMDSVCETTLGVEAHAQENSNMKVLDAFNRSCRLISDRITKPWLHYEPIYKLTANHAEYAGHVDTIYSFIQEVITDKRNEMAAKSISNNKIYDIEDEDRLMSFMELMIKSAGYTDTVLKEEIVVLFIAGTDTSALVTSFTSAMLARHPDIQAKVYKELQEVFGDSKRPVLYDDLPHLKYLEAVIKETMRLYPPAPILLRKVDEDVVLPSDMTLPKGTGIVIDVYATHRNPAYWGDDVETFRPERFNTPVKHPAAFLAFSNGPRNCIGYRYAMMSMKTSLATLLRHYEVAPISDKYLGQPIDLKFDIMLRATDNFQLILKPRP